jgi:putative serine protease PepD
MDPTHKRKRIQPIHTCLALEHSLRKTLRGGTEMNQTSRVSNANPPTPSRSALPLLGALLLGGSLLVAACGTGAISSGTTAASTPAASTTPNASSSASPAIAGALQNDFVSVVGRVSPSVVVIETTTGLGSGIVFDTSGDIVTNAHVVAGSTKFTVTLADGRKLAGTLVGTYPSGDIAVVHVAATGLQPATFGDSSKLVVGDIVLAVGNPLGLQTSVTQGIVSALGRQVSESKTVTLPNVIQTSAEINPGNSGGALVDLTGDVVGIPTLTALDPDLGNTAAPGIGFAISSNTVVDIAGQLIANGRVVSTPAPGGSPAPGESAAP